ncbi:type VI secretion system tip protein VgrG [Motilimonas sp. E26]|uniref:type VI secretion system Vgr family protein n=1 Tax=Motilimonas sp. E26 TaxID=2865674 RepID=UPI001E2EB1BF|nr:type VI secretion system tip protein VgrG [Motilimonas sp. E26]MCE0559156.1 type VI secretion system tip protein VgrG [Motilimonas sp. E26]
MLNLTGLQFSLVVDGVAPTAFSVVSFQGKEGISTPFTFHFELASRDMDIVANSVVDKSATLTVYQDGEIQKQINGIVSAFTQAEIGYHHTGYKLTLTAAIARLSLRQNSRIFQQLNVKEIISILLDEMGITDYVFPLKNALAAREYCVQYRESDLAFVERLAAEEGISYYFEHEKNKHSLVFCDDISGFAQLTIPIEHNGLSGGQTKGNFVKQFMLKNQVKSAKVATRDYSFKKPAYSFLIEKREADIGFQRDDYEYYDFPGRYKDDAHGNKFSQTRLEYLRRSAIEGMGDGNVPQMTAGYKFELSENLKAAFNRDWLLITVQHFGEQPQALEEAGGEGETKYNNHFTVIPGRRQWRAMRNEKPRVDGPQIAIVTGPPGEEIFCDEHGRVKVQFPWDRYGKSDENSSCWVRVSQGWAGTTYGMMAIPRIGHEVIVSFLEGDPDQPIITGRTYHATNRPPYQLPAHKTRTVLKTDTHKGAGSNEIRFEDELSREQIYIHGQKDLDIIIENNRREDVKFDHHLTVHNDKFELVKGDQSQTIGKESYQEIKGSLHQLIGKNFVQKIIGVVKRVFVGGVVTQIDAGNQTVIGASDERKVGANLRYEVNNEAYIKSSEMVLEAGQELTIKGPGGFIKIDGGGITISGNKVKINEGGSPGSGTKPSQVKPEAPSVPTIPDSADKR